MLVQPVNSLSFKQIYENTIQPFSKEQEKVKSALYQELRKTGKDGISLEQKVEDKNLDIILEKGEDDKSVYFLLTKKINNFTSENIANMNKMVVGNFYENNVKNLNKSYEDRMEQNETEKLLLRGMLLSSLVVVAIAGLSAGIANMSKQNSKIKALEKQVEINKSNIEALSKDTVVFN